MEIKPTRQNVLVEIEDESETTESGLYIPRSNTASGRRGKVLAVGRDVTEVKVGDTVIFFWVPSMERLRPKGTEGQFILPETTIEAVVE